MQALVRRHVARQMLVYFRCVPTYKLKIQSYSSAAAELQGNRNVYITLAGLLGALGGATWWSEDRETRQAFTSLERGSKPAADITLPASRALERDHLQNRLMELLKPYVCSMSHVDIVFGHEGIGKSEQVKQACRQLDGGTLYVDLQGSNRLGSQVLVSLTGEQSRSLLQRFRDFLRGGVDAHGIQILEKAAHRYVEAYDRYPVIAIDHVDPLRCALGDPSSPLLQLGHAYDPSAPSMRPILILNDSQLETLRQEAHPSSSFRVVAMDDASKEESKSLLLRNKLPAELAEMVVQLVGGRLSHLQEAIHYWTDSSRWLSPMKPSSSQQDIHAAFVAHFKEIKKHIFWDLDKRLRIEAGIGLWPSATGDAPVSHQKPIDEDAQRIVDLLAVVDSKAVPANDMRRAIGGERLLQLLQAQVLGYVPLEGPLDKLPQDFISFGSPAMHQYYKERLQNSVAADAKKGSASWTHSIFG